MAAGVPWIQKHMLFSLNCVASQAEEQKPSRTSGSSLVLSPSFYPLSLYAFPEKETMLLPAERVPLQFHHLILLETGTFTSLASYGLTCHSTESWTRDQRHGELPAWVCYGQQHRCKGILLVLILQGSFQRWSWLWTWKVCPRAARKRGVVTLITRASSPLAAHELGTPSTAMVQCLCTASQWHSYRVRWR